MLVGGAIAAAIGAAKAEAADHWREN